MNNQSITITVGNKNSTLEGKITGALLDIIREMPGRKRWKDRVLHFESSAGNIRHLKRELKEATFIDADKRLKAIEQAERLEVEARAQKQKPLPPEAGKSFPFVRKPYKHQLKSWSMYKDCPYFGLFFDLGCGKSKTTIDIVAAKWARGEIDCWLILCWPSSVHRQWALEAIPDHMPEMVDYGVEWYSPAKRNRILKNEKIFERSGKLRILTMNIEAMSHKSSQELALKFVRSGRCHVTIDESFTIKTPGSSRTKFTYKLRDESASRNVLTGTPIPEGLEDLYAQMLFLSPDILGFNSFYTFRNRYCEVVPAYRGAPMGAVKIVGYRNVKELWDKIDAHCYRVLEEDCLDLPRKIYISRDVALTKEQVKIYNDLADKMLFAVEAAGGHVRADEAIVRMMRMQQVVCGHVPVTTYKENGDENVKSVDVPTNLPQETIDIWEENKRQPMVVWARFHRDLDILEKAFAAVGAKTVRYDGTVKPKDRDKNKIAFMNREADIFLGNPASGGTGVDGLQKVCNVVVYYSNSPKAIDRQQSEGRTHRSGMGKACRYYDLIVRKTVCEHFFKLLKEKKDIASAFLDNPEGWKILATKINLD